MERTTEIRPGFKHGWDRNAVDYIPELEQIIPLADTCGMLRHIASAEIAMHGVYYCMIDGKRTKVTP